MKSIGLIGGMSWESSTLYYQIINREVARRLGGLHSARFIMNSLDFANIAAMQRAGDWDGMTGILATAARGLEANGADCILIGTNTMHKVAPEVAAAVNVPLLHIADVTAEAIVRSGIDRVALLGTCFTMEQPFYRERLAARGIECLIPDESQRKEIHRVIFEELCRGEILDSSRRTFLQIIDELAAQGAAGVVLGCTEIPLLIGAGDTSLPVFDTTELHALAAVDFALGHAAIN
ncbi:aspartate/glutamate racemase family protein [Paludibacterium yongneupense]|uniref:aspartate/glutamate racemase family protein n=1 Tax=Paludibacterium yongneupense TaxID=400061 RepID=UPI0004092EA5|nr:aspartate/glutamate racemase family protein [Paludibacterium yongneupense]